MTPTYNNWIYTCFKSLQGDKTVTAQLSNYKQQCTYIQGIAVAVAVMEVLLAQAKFEKFKASQHFQPKTDTSDIRS